MPIDYPYIVDYLPCIDMRRHFDYKIIHPLSELFSSSLLNSTGRQVMLQGVNWGIVILEKVPNIFTNLNAIESAGKRQYIQQKYHTHTRISPIVKVLLVPTLKLKVKLSEVNKDIPIRKFKEETDTNLNVLIKNLINDSETDLANDNGNEMQMKIIRVKLDNTLIGIDDDEPVEKITIEDQVLQ